MGKQTGNDRLARLWFKPVIEYPIDAVEGLTLNAYRQEGELVAFLPRERPTAEDLKSVRPTHDSDASDQPIRMALENPGFSAPVPVAEQLPIVPDELPMTEEAKSGRSTLDLDAKLDLADQPIGIACEASDLSAQLFDAEQLSLFPNELLTADDGGPRHDRGSQDDSQRSEMTRQNIDFAAGPQTKDTLINQFPNARRISRSHTRFFIAVLMGSGAMFAWQYHSGETSKVARAEIPPLNQLSTLSTAPPIMETIHSTIDKTNETVGIPTFTPGWATSFPPTQWTMLPGSVAGSAVASSALAPQLEDIARNLADLQYRSAQLAEKQDKMAQNMAALQAIEQDISHKISSPFVTQVVVPLPPRKKTPRVARWYPAARGYVAQRPLPLR
jgi:hypothetical protein